MVPFKVKTQKDVLQVVVDAKARRDWEQWVLLTSDRHWDNPKSDRLLQSEHLKKAIERKAIIIDNGDLFCLMNGRGDLRGSKSKVRPEHNRNDYLDAVINDAANYFAPYAENFALVATGNHEASVSQRTETDITKRFVDKVNTLNPDSQLHAGGVTGFVRLTFKIGTEFYSYLIDYHHGVGAGGGTTKGIGNASKRAMYSDADILISGHSHEAWSFPIQRRKVTQAGKIYHPTQWHLQIPGYKEHYGKGAANWENLRGFPPKPLGCVWLRFFYHRTQRDKQETTRRVSFERSLDLVEFGA